MPKKRKCPICKAELDDKTAKYVEDHAGQKYYFCSGSCMKEFSSGPERYIKD